MEFLMPKPKKNQLCWTRVFWWHRQEKLRDNGLACRGMCSTGEQPGTTLSSEKCMGHPTFPWRRKAAGEKPSNGSFRRCHQ